MRSRLKRLLCAAIAFMSLHAGMRAQELLPDGQGKETLENMCSECHGIDKIVSRTRTRKEWTSTVTRMIGRGASLSDSEASTLIDYLVEYFGEDAGARVNVNKATAKEIEVALHISSKDALAIVSHREKNGKFTRWQDLTQVDGIDKAKIEAQKERLEF